jgi:hypothetical protein
MLNSTVLIEFECLTLASFGPRNAGFSYHGPPLMSLYAEVSPITNSCFGNSQVMRISASSGADAGNRYWVTTSISSIVAGVLLLRQPFLNPASWWSWRMALMRLMQVAMARWD